MSQPVGQRGEEYERFPGRDGATATVEVDPRAVGAVRMTYAPDPDGAPDPGEIVWTWVPYEEADGRGKDRPVLVVAQEGHRDGSPVLAVQLTSRARDGGQEWLPLGSGPWDREGRESWVGLDRVLRVHPDGMRREACALDRARFNAVVHRLQQVHGWR
ncbi:type II toxin-antitoxin system PemK/MazF family toxin [Streptomyces smyrnaeus]|uniref:type II toxin-antitoxin system PemK/MazF family toxin n=1 Tax=Streptomyces smyrnaeus TaxID=1387713 RepID=UPI0033ABAAFF